MGKGTLGEGGEMVPVASSALAFVVDFPGETAVAGMAGDTTGSARPTVGALAAFGGIAWGMSDCTGPRGACDASLPDGCSCHRERASGHGGRLCHQQR